ncbi:flagellar motor switch protein FliN [Rosistilla oblonga]|uniref:Flagellar motor switch protein FliN n=1 Tax=Rosistilla oblonga TaxID=2527990 RepID=A0A518IU16_9BACT|nr:flagellar motor switch protein FliN [Rosistilla oblonga]QDV56583.1 Flagellar motor switch protein FliN [Rosistilla oblonga]
MSDDGSQTQNPPPSTDSGGGDDARSTAGMEQLLDQAQADLAAADGPAAPTAANPQPFPLDELQSEAGTDDIVSLNILSDVDLDLRIELGRTHMRLEDVLQLRSGSVVALDRLAGDPVDVFVNDRLVARGEVLVLNESFCVRVTELVSGGNA